MTSGRLLRLLAAGATGYLLGMTPSARIASRLAPGRRVDPASHGTGNPGAFNVARLLGRRYGFAVAAADVGKGLGASVLGRRLAGDTGAHLGAVAAVAGHCYPRGGVGGLGVATSFGQCLATFPVFAPADVGLALMASRLPARRPAMVSVATSSLCWVAAGALWWRWRLPNLWGPPPGLALPLANAVTSVLIGSRGFLSLREHRPDELGRRRRM